MVIIQATGHFKLEPIERNHIEDQFCVKREEDDNDGFIWAQPDKDLDGEPEEVATQEVLILERVSDEIWART